MRLSFRDLSCEIKFLPQLSSFMRAAKVLPRLRIFASLTATESYSGRDKVLHDARHDVRLICVFT